MDYMDCCSLRESVDESLLYMSSWASSSRGLAWVLKHTNVASGAFLKMILSGIRC